ncbi:MAG: curved DNA-binding protein [Mariniblastus sp.]|jgi:curved DNA-binding protein
MADEDYYKVLGVARSASADEIQKSYRRLARKYHPDLHADEDERERERAKQQFQKVQQAYDVLSDAKKRQMYDQMGPGFEQMGGNPYGGGGGGGSPFGGAGAGGIDLSQIFGGGGGGGFEDIFRQMGGAAPGGRRQPAGPMRGSDVEQSITVPFSVSVMGGQHQVSLQRRNGKVDKIDVKIPAGIEPGKRIRLRGQGQSGGEGGLGPRGDLMITVNVAPHPSYSRQGLNLKVTVPITMTEAAAGTKVDLPTPHGTVALTVPPACNNGKSLRLKGMGIKSRDKSGDLIAVLQITMPTEITKADLETLKQLSDSWSDPAVRNELSW